MDEYSQLKPLWHLDRMDDLRKGRTTKPVHVQLILSDLCNQDCHFCAYRMSAGLSTELFGTAKTHNPNRKIKTDKAEEIINDCAEMGVKAIQFTGGGEPTVHPDYLKLFALAQHLGMKTALVTNGIRLDPSHHSIQGMDWIRVSIDAGMSSTYAKIRRVTENHWNKAWHNIAALRDFKGNLGVGFVVTTDNYREIDLCAIKCKDSGVKNMRVGAVFSSEGIHYYGDRIDRICDSIRQAKDIYDSKDFEIIDLFGRRLSDLEHGSPDEEFCGYQYFTMYIGADLNVYRCCNTAYTTRGIVGNLENIRLRDLVPNYAPFDARTCKFCQFMGQNQAINSALRVPADVDFV